MTAPGNAIIGRVFSGRYEVLSQVARGGMAEVYRARDNLLGRPVALKILHPEFAIDQSFVERFRREAQAAANLNHPHIVAVYDWGTENGTYFMVLEYVEGQSLRDILRTDGPQPIRRVVEIAAETASALHFAHRHGVVHRDVKPGNILITTGGETKVTDFGIARAANVADGLTQTGAVIGTATYFSPEQAQGFSVDARTDVYSLGVVMYESLAGTAPFLGDSPMAVAYKHVREAPPPLSRQRGDVPGDLEAIVGKCLQKSPDNRYQSAEDLRQDLARFAQGQPVTAARTAAVAAAPTAVVAATEAVPLTVPQPPRTRVEQPGYYESPNRWPIVTLVVLLIVSLAVGAVLLANSLFGRDGASQVGVPDVLGAQYEPSGRQAIERAGLIPVPIIVSDDSVPQGIVITTSPPPGTSIEKNGTVRVTISAGKETVKVPALVGQTRADAEKAIREAGFEVGQVTEKSDDKIDKGKVISQDPPAGADAGKGSKIDLVVSAGKEKVKVPFVEGRDAFEAAQQLNQVGLQVDRKEEFSSEVKEGRVIRTDPKPDTEVDKGSKVTLYVSKGVEKVAVPDVLGDEEAAARTKIEEAGLEVEVVEQETTNPSQVGKVISQSPGGGTEVDKGETVTINVGRAPVATTTSTSTTTTLSPFPTSTTTTTTTRG